MIKRFVKLTFIPDKVNDFLDIFVASKKLIRAHEGCRHLELLQDTTQTHVFFTLSYWDDVDALEKYRRSDLFISTWAKTKILFSDKAEAWSVNLISEL